MTIHIATFDHLRFTKDGGTLVVTSWRDSGFETTFDFPSDLDAEEDIDEELHERFYGRAASRYDDYVSAQ